MCDTCKAQHAKRINVNKRGKMINVTSFGGSENSFFENFDLKNTSPLFTLHPSRKSIDHSI